MNIENLLLYKVQNREDIGIPISIIWTPVVCV